MSVARYQSSRSYTPIFVRLGGTGSIVSLEAKMAAKSNDFEAMLKPFYQRASEAEDRLARLEAALSGNKDSGDKELLKSVDELQSKPEDSKPEHVVQKEETMQVVMQLRAENEKLQYRIIHLVRALKDADSKLALK